MIVAAWHVVQRAKGFYIATLVDDDLLWGPFVSNSDAETMLAKYLSGTIDALPPTLSEQKDHL